MFLFFQGFQPQNVLILLFSTKHSYVFTMKITSDVSNSFNWDTGYIKYFNKNLEEYKVIYPDETPDYITKDDFDSVQIILLYVNLLKQIQIIISFFSSWTSQPQNILNLFLFI